MISILICTFLTLIIINYFIFKHKLYPKTFLDLPDKFRKKHKEPIPNLGIIFFIPFFILLNYSNSGFEFNTHFLLFCLIFIIIGIFDDIFSLKWNIRIFCESIFILSYLLLSQELLLNELNLNDIILNDILPQNFYLIIFFTSFCFIALVNALNFYDGINNQLSNYLIILFLFFFVETANYLFLTLIIILLTFSIFNFQNKVFLGSASIYLVAFLIFNFSTFYHNEHIIEADSIFIMLFYPGIDMIRLFFFRILRKKDPFKGDRNHIHHILESKFNPIKIVWINNIPIIISLIITQIPSVSNWYAMLFIIIYYIMILNLNKKL